MGTMGSPLPEQSVPPPLSSAPHTPQRAWRIYLCLVSLNIPIYTIYIIYFYVNNRRYQRQQRGGIRVRVRVRVWGCSRHGAPLCGLWVSSFPTPLSRPLGLPLRAAAAAAVIAVFTLFTEVWVCCRLFITGNIIISIIIAVIGGSGGSSMYMHMSIWKD